MGPQPERFKVFVTVVMVDNKKAAGEVGSVVETQCMGKGHDAQSAVLDALGQLGRDFRELFLGA